MLVGVPHTTGGQSERHFLLSLLLSHLIFGIIQLGDKMRKHQMTNEAKVALKLATLIDSATLDLDRVGLELARLSPTTHYNRLILIAEAAVEEQGRIYDRANLDTLF